MGDRSVEEGLCAHGFRLVIWGGQASPLALPHDRGASAFDLDDALDLDRGAERQRGHADGGAGVPALVAEHPDDEVGGAVGDEVMLGEFRRRGDEAR